MDHVKECNLERDTRTGEPESDADFDISPPSNAISMGDTNDSSSPSDLSDD